MIRVLDSRFTNPVTNKHLTFAARDQRSTLPLATSFLRNLAE
ncbi:Uncharacterised protein [Amycolatopsis camponoti]|uniref:Uncharacterized protein n=1 Tax=Amycolatopsis camponoti TaxID=2606593 RepID=A0A6I8LYL3_9PSEU|nr:Uncharacterised protein [Amycolatopsis camponoti]